MTNLVTAIANFLTAAKRAAITNETFPQYGPYPPPPIPGVGYPYGSGNYGNGLYGYGEGNP